MHYRRPSSRSLAITRKDHNKPRARRTGSACSPRPESDDLMVLLAGCVTDYAVFTLDPEANIAAWGVGA